MYESIFFRCVFIAFKEEKQIQSAFNVNWRLFDRKIVQTAAATEASTAIAVIIAWFLMACA